METVPALNDQRTLDPGLAEQIERLDRALEAGDVPCLEALLAEDFIQVAPSAVAKDRAQWFDWFDRIVRYDAMRREFVASRTFADVTVVISDCSPVMRVKGGEPSVHTARMLEVWAHRDGVWRKAVEQYTRPPQNPPGTESGVPGRGR